MSLPSVGWGILGTGNIARQFAVDLQQAQAGPIVAVASRDPARAARFIGENLSAGYPIAACDYDQLLANPGVQAVYVALPNTLHHGWTIQALQAGKHVLCEKPLAVDLDQAKEMFAAADRCGRLLMEAWMYRCHPMTHAWMDQIRQGAIGQVQLVRASFCYLTRNIRQNIRFRPELAGGVLYDLGVYPVSLVQWIAGQEPLDVQLMAHRHESGVDDCLTGIMRFPGGLLASFSCGMNLQADNSAQISGSGGYLTIPVPWKPPVSNARFSLGYSSPPKMDGPSSPHQAGLAAQSPREFSVDAPCGLYGLEARVFAAAIVDQAPLPVTPADSLSVIRTLMRLKACLDRQD